MPEQSVERLLRIGRAGWASLPVATPVPGLSIPGGAKSILVLRASGCVILADDGKPIMRPDKITFTPANRIDKGRFRQHVAVYEGNVSYMYLDVKGLVTVGVGHMIPDADAAKKLPFFSRKTRAPAHPLHIGNAYNRVRNSGRKGRHTNFRNLTHIDLSPAAIETLFEDDVNQFLPLIRGENWFAGYDFESYPAGVQLGMLDLVYNMGARRFFDNYNMFKAALQFRNWIGVADQSSREPRDPPKVGKIIQKIVDRNKVVRGWILEAIDDEPFFLNPDCSPTRLGSIPG